MPKSKRTDLDRLITEALAIEAESARDAGQLGFMCRALAQATMPHRATDALQFTRRNGNFHLAMTATAPKVPLPFGSTPRLLISWLTTAAVSTGKRELELGNTLRHFLDQLGFERSGGPRGGITRVKQQMERLFAAAITCTYTGDDRHAGTAFTVANDWALWWDTKQPDQAGLWRSHVRLSERFFQEVTEHPVPVDLRALKALRRSPMAIDAYVWLAYRMSYLRERTVIPWAALEVQFGANYAHTRQFRAAFNRHMQKVLTVYPEARVEPDAAGLVLRPSPTHVSKLPPGG